MAQRRSAPLRRLVSVTAAAGLACALAGPALAKVTSVSTDGEATVYLNTDFGQDFDLAYDVTFEPAPENKSWSTVRSARSFRVRRFRSVYHAAIRTPRRSPRLRRRPIRMNGKPIARFPCSARCVAGWSCVRSAAICTRLSMAACLHRGRVGGIRWQTLAFKSMAKSARLGTASRQASFRPDANSRAFQRLRLRAPSRRKASNRGRWGRREASRLPVHAAQMLE